MQIPHLSEYSGLLRAHNKHAYLIKLSLFTFIRSILGNHMTGVLLGTNPSYVTLSESLKASELFPFYVKGGGCEQIIHKVSSVQKELLRDIDTHTYILKIQYTYNLHVIQIHKYTHTHLNIDIVES